MTDVATSSPSDVDDALVRSWLLDELPPYLAADPVLRRLLRMLQTIVDGIRHEIDGLEHVVDIGTTPAQFVPWLSGWVGAERLDDGRDLRRSRVVARVAGRSWPRRGTARALHDNLRAATRSRVRVRDDGGVGRAGSVSVASGHVRVEVEATRLPAADVVAVAMDHLPAHASLEVWIGRELVHPTTRRVRRSTELEP